ncbi:MAG TPA: mechanosensitive ion channel family protein [Methylophaga sp.]|nr:mechanosensitive ion channel family protein [Methylophaga sp.]
MEVDKILFDQLLEMAKSGIELMPQFLLSIVIIVITYFLAKLSSSIATRFFRTTKMRKSLINLLVLLSSIFVWMLGFMIAAIVLFPNLTPTKMLAGLGIGSVAIGFAFKDIFENFLSGVLILLRPQMRIGDYIECEGLEGKVENILVRETHIRQTDGQLVVMPNSMLFKNPLTILTDIPERRITVICGVAYKEDVDQARKVIKNAVLECKSVISDRRKVEIFAQEFADSSINFEVTWWTGSTPLEVRISRDEVIAAVKRALDDAGIEIPFPYRTLTFDQSLKIDAQPSGQD